jgi:hypothetical protein
MFTSHVNIGNDVVQKIVCGVFRCKHPVVSAVVQYPNKLGQLAPVCASENSVEYGVVEISVGSCIV